MQSWENDIYFDEKYGLVNEKVELGESIHYELRSQHGIITSNFIKRHIPLPQIDSKWYDIRTPYGYGGPLICDTVNKEKLIEDYKKDFYDYCMSNNIVTEFIRFHPIAQNFKDFQSIYNVSFDRHTVGTNLHISDDPIGMEFSKKCRKNIRRAINNGLSYCVIESPDNLDIFKHIYIETMDRNHASEFYYFDDYYFEDLLRYFSKKLLVIYVKFKNIIVAAGLYFVSNRIVHIHLSGTLNDYMYLNPPYVLRYAVAKWAIERNIDYLHHGGGRTNSPDDTLYLFKKQFGIHTNFDFYIGEKIWNYDVYKNISKVKRPNEHINDYIRRMNDCEKNIDYC